MDNKNKAVSCFKDFNCCQSVVSTFASRYNLDYELALKIAGPFGGGIGRMGETCGAVTGAFMVIGLKHGQTMAGDKVSKEKTYQLVQEFSRRFRQKYNSIWCKELLGCDLSTEEGAKMAKEKDLFRTFCPRLIEEAVDILEDMLKDDRKA